MNRSLRGTLSVWLTVCICTAGVVAGALSFGLAYIDANDSQDEQLKQIAQLLSRPDSFPVSGPYLPKNEEDAETHLVVKRIGPGAPVVNPMTDVTVPGDTEPGLHTLDQSGTGWRVMVTTNAAGERFAVAQRTQLRNESARSSALLTLIPLLMLIPLLLLILRWVLARAFAPLTDVSTVVDRLKDTSLAPLVTDTVPSEVLPLMQAVNRLLARLDHALAQQRRFISDAAHELRTPVTASIVQAENVMHAESSPDARARMVPLRQGLARIASLLEQLLGLARIQGAAPRAAATIDLRLLVRGVIEGLLPAAQARRIDLGCPRFEAASIEGDPLNVQALVRNAVDNAVKYTPVGGAVDVSVFVEGGSARVVVEDNGPGIAEHDLERVFEPFVRVLGTQEVGSGLGLAIARTAADALGGRIVLSARHDGTPGLRFTYTQAT